MPGGCRRGEPAATHGRRGAGDCQEPGHVGQGADAARSRREQAIDPNGQEHSSRHVHRRPLVFAIDFDNKPSFSPQNFADFVNNGLSALYQVGVRYFEVHNEPNLKLEGLEWNWRNGAEFGSWFTQVLGILRQRCPRPSSAFRPFAAVLSAGHTGAFRRVRRVPIPDGRCAGDSPVRLGGRPLLLAER